MSANFKKLFWDTAKAGDERARLTPWLYAEHASYVEAQIAAVRAVQGDEEADKIDNAYSNNKELYCSLNGCDCEEETKECDKGECEEKECEDCEEVLEEKEDMQEEASDKEEKKAKKAKKTSTKSK